MVGKNNAAVIASIGKISTPKVTTGRSLDFAGAVDSFLRGYDWGDNLRKQKEEEANREALALALQAEDEAQIADAWAKFDPMGYAERLDKIKEARIKREQVLADAESKHNRAVALEELRNRLGIKRDEATHERELALEKLKRDWSLEDKGLERQYKLEDAEAKRQDFYAQKAFEKELEAQYEKEDVEKLPKALVYANELDKLDPNNPAHQPRIKILNGLLAKEMAISGGKANVAKEIQLINMRASLDPNDPVQAEQIKLIDGILVGNKQGTKAKELQLIDRLNSLDPNDPNNTREINLLESALSGKQQQQKDTRTTEEKRYDFAQKMGYSDEESTEFAMKTGKFAPNQPKPQKTLEEITAEEEAKTKGREKAKKDIVKAAALENLKNKMNYFEKRANKVLEAVNSGVGIGEIEYPLSSVARPLLGGLNEEYFENASINQQSVEDFNNVMRDLVRDAMATQNINARQADTQWEQQKMFYDISPDMDEIRIKERVNNFKEYINQIKSGNPYYTPEEGHQQKKPVKILSITEEK